MTQHFILDPGYFRLDGGAMFGIIPKPLWEKSAPADSLNRIRLSLRLWCLKTQDRLVVVDTGIGDYHDQQFNDRFDVHQPVHPLNKCLQQVGFSCDEVTDLVISHLHFDHVGGLGRKVDGQWQLTFKNARCHVHKNHWEYSQSPTLRDSGSFHTHNFLPLLEEYRQQDRLHLYEGEEGELFDLEDGDKLRFKVSHGHTPFLMHPYSNQYIYLADLIPTSHHVHVPWVMGYDISPGITTQNKLDFLNFIQEKDLTLIFEHDPDFWGAKVEKSPKGKFICRESYSSDLGKAYLVS